ncbi:MAG: PQQ-like beta-propeller repeat protein, partial [Candidatus Hydrogenedentes bacterium]|nr:PQQ-like beta-propeller repeat protein [Candidatus Hydrogenedentota bacterium]
LWKSESIDRCDGSPSSGKGILAFGSCASALHVISAENGTILKNISLGDEAQVAGGVAIRGNSLFSGSHGGELFHADIEKGVLLWTNTDADGEVFTTPAVSAKLVVYGSMDDNFYALDRATGTLRWKFKTNGMTMSPVIAKDTVVACSGGVLYLLDLETGVEQWSFEVSDEITSPSIINGMILVGSDDGTLSAFGKFEG